MKRNYKRAACICLTAVMTASLAASNVLAFADTNGNSLPQTRTEAVNFEDVTGKVDLSSVTLKNLSSSVMENSKTVEVKDETRTVIVTLNKNSVLDCMPEGGRVEEYLASYSGKKAARAVSEAQKEFLSQLSDNGIGYSLKYKYDTVANAVAIEVNTKYLSKIKSLPSVKSAAVSETYAVPETVTGSSGEGNISLESMYATGIYNSSKYTAQGYDGSGISVAILDTGLDYTHEAFSTENFTASSLAINKQHVTDKLSSESFNAVSRSANKGVTVGADELYVSDKVPFAYDYADNDADVYPSYSQHGTHVAGIVAGNAKSYKDKNGNQINEAFLGAAPNAQLVICKVFTDDFEDPDLGGATSEDIVAALDDCVKLGVDIINMSLGTTAGFSSKYIEGDSEGAMLNEVYDKVRQAGINLICAASNDFSSGYGSAYGTNRADSPDSGTVGSPSTYWGALSVASINGQLSPYMLANDTRIYFQDASDANNEKYDFIGTMLGKNADGSYKTQSKTFRYVAIPGVGRSADYTEAIMNIIRGKAEGEKIIAVVQRGTTTFKDKVALAQEKGFDGIIIYNNVAGTIGMTLGDLEDPIPAVSVTADAGRALVYDENGNRRLTGEIEINATYSAGPFMNDYSSWGTTPDLKLKPEITAHGGEITSTVSGGYDEMSGTSMATPNLAGFAALVRSYLDKNYSSMIEATRGSLSYERRLTQLVNQVMMSTAVTVYDHNYLPYSPRKQGAGLATLDNVFGTQAYLWTDAAEDNRPKIELGYDENCTGVKDAKSVFENLTFKVTNFGNKTLKFKTQAIFMTETLSANGAVAEKAFLLGDDSVLGGNPSEWKVGGVPLAKGEAFEVPAGETVTVSVTLSLSDAEKKYIQKSFENGMFIEGFLKLLAVNGDGENQCDLTLPFMGFYGNWKSAPLLDYDCYEIAEFEKDKSNPDEEPTQPQVWATQAYAMYYNQKYSIPMGSFAYIQDENDSVEKIYTEKEHVAISCYNIYKGEDDTSNYMTTTKIRALYAGLLRNAELVTYDLYNDETGELISGDNCVYNVSKAYAGGGGVTPGNVKMELDPLELQLVPNGKYRLDYKFYFKVEDKDAGEIPEENTFSMVFYVDYEAPILTEARVRFRDYKEGTQDKQSVYLDLDIYDNHYAQSVVLCYAATEGDLSTLNMATRYATPVYNAVKNGISSVSIDITDIYEQYGNKLYMQIDDYALNHHVYQLFLNDALEAELPENFEIVGDTEITVGVNQSYKVALEYEGEANLANFTWVSARSSIAEVKNGEIFGKRVGDTVVTVIGANGAFKTVTVHVVESTTTLLRPNISFGAIIGSGDNLVKAQGSVNVNAGMSFKMEIVPDPWYYDVSTLKLKWISTNEEIATVDQDGNVITKEKRGSATIRAIIMNGEDETLNMASVTLNVQEPFTISNYTLTKYHGLGGEDGVLTIPQDKNIMTIGEEAFKDNDNIRVIILPKTVTQIQEKAFINCTALEEVYFISQDKIEPANASLSLILRRAFYGCNKLKKLDLSNCKTITVDKEAFYNCAALQQVVDMDKIGTMNNRAFAGCTSLQAADVTGLHTAGASVFEGCTSLATVTTGKYTAVGERIFAGCTSLQQITINAQNIGAEAFYGCTSLKTVSFGESGATGMTFNVGDRAFAGCTGLNTVNYIGRVAYSGNSAFDGTPYYNTATALYANGGATLLLAPKVITGAFSLSGVTEIAPYAFSGSSLSGISTLNLSGVTKIGEGAFANLNVTGVTLSASLTEISARAFEGSALTTIQIPAGVTAIGNRAFANCASLNSVTFAAGSALKALGDGVFAGCTSLTGITLPDGVTEMGSQTFANCTNLVTANLPALKALGSLTFYNCLKLTTVTFNANAETVGEFTFAGNTHLTTVTIGEKTSQIGAYAFSGCTSLESINLKNATVISECAFLNCKALKTVEGLDKATIIGVAAFNGCGALTALNLTSALEVGAYAFYGASFATLNIPAVKQIGAFAFAGGKITSVALPASLQVFGDGAFSLSENLKSYEVSPQNNLFFAEEGVLYRYISKDDGKYELCAYPTGKIIRIESDNLRTYEVKEGTVSVRSQAFRGLNSGTVTKIKLPYTVKELGDGAFFASGIIEYHFESINAPVLLSGLTYDESTVIYSLYNTNFYDEFILHTSGLISVSATGATLRIYRPTNGYGYDNYLYANYFSSVVMLGELIEDATRGLKTTLESLEDAATVKSWNNLDASNAQNIAMVTAFSQKVMQAHGVYNNIRSEKQIELLGAENVQKMFDIEAELKSVKAKFGIGATPISLTVSEDSTYKREYVAGEKFDPKGLILIVTYDDYSTEVADMANVTLSSGYDGELTTLIRYVEYRGYGNRVRVPITVRAEGTNPPEGPGNTGDGDEGVNPAVIYGPIIGVVVAAAIAVAVVLLIKNKKTVFGKGKGKTENAENGEAAEAQSEGEASNNNPDEQ